MHFLLLSSVFRGRSCILFSLQHARNKLPSAASQQHSQWVVPGHSPCIPPECVATQKAPAAAFTSENTGSRDHGMETHFPPLLLHGSMRVLAWKVRFKFSSMLREEGLQSALPTLLRRGTVTLHGHSTSGEVASSVCSTSAGCSRKWHSRISMTGEL